MCMHVRTQTRTYAYTHTHIHRNKPHCLHTYTHTKTHTLMCKYKWVADSADTHVGTDAHTNPHLCKSEFRHTFCVTHKHKQARTHPIRAAAKIGIILTQSKCAQIASLFSLSFLSLALCHSLTLSLSHSVSRPGSWQQASRQHFSRRGFPSAHTQKTTQ